MAHLRDTTGVIRDRTVRVDDIVTPTVASMPTEAIAMP
jgi:hypothetical protein